jgi:cytidine deaminase
MVDQATIDRLRAAAHAAGSVACYPRYSGFRVTAAVLTATDDVYGGANVEVVNYSLTKHAEETAALAAIAAGALQHGDAWLRAVYVHTAAPCGSCRQFLWEFAVHDAVVVIDRRDGQVTQQRLAELLPDPFDPSELPDRRIKGTSEDS